MTAPLAQRAATVRVAELADPHECDRFDDFIDGQPAATPFHSRPWLAAVTAATRHPADVIVVEERGRITGALPLHRVQSPFGNALISSGFGVGGGILAETPRVTHLLAQAAEEMAARCGSATIELRGGALAADRGGWAVHDEAHAGFTAPLAASDEAQLMAIPRKQRAEVRRALGNDLEVRIGVGPRDRAAHYRVYAESVRNLGTPVFPRALFDQVLDRFENDADILTVFHAGEPVASVLSLYWRGAVMPYWGGGRGPARVLRANDAMYLALMRHARERGCQMFDFGRSKTGSGAYHFKRNWGFAPQALAYATWTAPGAQARNVSPTNARFQAGIAAWKRLPLVIANRVGPIMARGLA